tara:strand:+ start:62 stop:322 length:261 start_codon:yes stop_codon:yes gene_type:complete
MLGKISIPKKVKKSKSKIEDLVKNDYIRKNLDVDNKICIILDESVMTRMCIDSGIKKVKVYLVYVDGTIRKIEKNHVEVVKNENIK